jgi:cytochrome bd-type quinol oxidase subunit 1
VAVLAGIAFWEQLGLFFFVRSQMGMSLAFHIIFAVIGMAMPLLMVVSEGCYLWTKKPIYLELSKRWAAATAILSLSKPQPALLKRG